MKLKTYSNIYWIESSIGPVGYDLFKNELIFSDSASTTSDMKDWLSEYFFLFDPSIPSFAAVDQYNSQASPIIEWPEKYWTITIEIDNTLFSVTHYIELLTYIKHINHLELIIFLKDYWDLNSIDFRDFEPLNSLYYSFRVIVKNPIESDEQLSEFVHNSNIGKYLPKLGYIIFYNCIGIKKGLEIRMINNVKVILSSLPAIDYKSQHKNITKYFKSYYPWYSISSRFNLFYFKIIEINRFIKMGYFTDYEHMVPINDFKDFELMASSYYDDITSINKDLIQTCQHCPLRYGCLDSRIPTYDSMTNSFIIKNVLECGIQNIFPGFSA